MDQIDNQISQLIRWDRIKCQIAFSALLVTIILLIFLVAIISVIGIMKSHNILLGSTNNYYLLFYVPQSALGIAVLPLIRKFESLLKFYLDELKKFRDEIGNSSKDNTI